MVLDSEITGLADLHAYLKYGNYVARFSFPRLEIPPSKPRFIARLEDDYIVREPCTDQLQAAKTEERPESPTGTDSKPICDAPGKQIVGTESADQGQEERQGELSFGPTI
jgi:hypothetical protein